MNGGTVRLVYDGDGDRVEKIANGVVTKYLVDDLNPTGYPQVVEETGSVERTYTYGLQRISENQIINGVQTPSFYGYDGMGNVRQLTDFAGAVTDSYEYDAFGNEISHTGTTPNEMLYRGEQYDPDLGLYYLRARYYNPATGRFMSRDLEDGRIKIPATLHKYLYVGDDPVDWIDPSGRDLVGFVSLARKVVAAGTALAIASEGVNEILDCIAEAIESAKPTPTPVANSPSGGCFINRHVESNEPPTGEPPNWYPRYPGVGDTGESK